MNINEPLVSVIINCYNGEKYLKEAIDSVIAQTYKNWEIIFWDNQSTDNSSKIVSSYSDKRIKYFYARNHTFLGEARNYAVKKATGEWISFLDCDDIWYEDKLECQLKKITANVGMLYSRARLFVDGSSNHSFMAKSIKNKIYPKFKKLPSGNIFDDLLYDCFIPFPSVLIRKDLFFKVGGINNFLKVAEDYDIFLKLTRISKVIALDRVLCVYRIHKNNLSHDNYEVTFKESIKLIEGYSVKRNVAHNVIYWKLKYLKYLIKTGYYKKSFIFALRLNLCSILLMIKQKYLFTEKSI